MAQPSQPKCLKNLIKLLHPKWKLHSAHIDHRALGLSYLGRINVTLKETDQIGAENWQINGPTSSPLPCSGSHVLLTRKGLLLLG